MALPFEIVDDFTSMSNVDARNKMLKNYSLYYEYPMLTFNQNPPCNEMLDFLISNGAIKSGFDVKSRTGPRRIAPESGIYGETTPQSGFSKAMNRHRLEKLAKPRIAPLIFLLIIGIAAVIMVNIIGIFDFFDLFIPFVAYFALILLLIFVRLVAKIALKAQQHQEAGAKITFQPQKTNQMGIITKEIPPIMPPQQAKAANVILFLLLIGAIVVVDLILFPKVDCYYYDRYYYSYSSSYYCDYSEFYAYYPILLFIPLLVGIIVANLVLSHPELWGKRKPALPVLILLMASYGGTRAAVGFGEELITPFAEFGTAILLLVYIEIRINKRQILPEGNIKNFPINLIWIALFAAANIVIGSLAGQEEYYTVIAPVLWFVIYVNFALLISKFIINVRIKQMGSLYQVKSSPNPAASPQLSPINTNPSQSQANDTTKNKKSLWPIIILVLIFGFYSSFILFIISLIVVLILLKNKALLEKLAQLGSKGTQKSSTQQKDEYSSNRTMKKGVPNSKSIVPFDGVIELDEIFERDFESLVKKRSICLILLILDLAILFNVLLSSFFDVDTIILGLGGFAFIMFIAIMVITSNINKLAKMKPVKVFLVYWGINRYELIPASVLIQGDEGGQSKYSINDSAQLVEFGSTFQPAETILHVALALKTNWKMPRISDAQRKFNYLKEKVGYELGIKPIDYIYKTNSMEINALPIFDWKDNMLKNLESRFPLS